MATYEEMVELPYSDDLTEAGVAHLLQVLRHQGGHKTYESFDAMRQHVSEKAVMLAFRRYLDGEDVPYTLAPQHVFQSGGEPELLLGGRRTSLFVTLISDRRSITQARKEPQRLTSLPSLVPRDIDQTLHSHEAIYIFAALFGLVTRSQEGLQKAIAAGQPARMIYPMPSSWRQPAQWRALDNLVVKTDGDESIALTLAGQNGERHPLETELIPTPQEREHINDDYHALHYLTTNQLPTGPVGVHSAVLDDTEVAGVYQWGNLWVYGMEIRLLGYLTTGEYHRQARYVPAGSKRFGVPNTEQPFWNVSAYHLRSMADLLGRVRNWSDQ